MDFIILVNMVLKYKLCSFNSVGWTVIELYGMHYTPFIALKVLKALCLHLLTDSSGNK